MKEAVFKNLSIAGNICDILCRGGEIAEIGKTDKEGIDFGGRRVFPGLVDIHTHGMGGIDTMDADIKSLAPLYARAGTTTVYPTTMTCPHGEIEKVLEQRIPEGGAKIAGFHLEGPYINKNCAGAQGIEAVRPPDIKEFANHPSAKIITLAPEIEGAIEYIKKTDMTVCVGHTAADYDTVINAARCGARCLTHTFNAMPPLHHRNPSAIGAAFDENMYVQVICDGRHIHPAVIRMLYKLFGTERMILISDSMRATGLADGNYDLGGQIVSVRDGTARTQSGALAGSTSTLLDCVKCAVSFGIPESDAFKMASETPANMMGLNCGTIEKGRACDLIVLNDDYSIYKVIMDGKIIL